MGNINYLNILFLYYSSFDIFLVRFNGAIMVIILTLILWGILAYFLLRQEHNVKNENMANRYKEVSLNEINKYGIEIKEFKKIYIISL